LFVRIGNNNGICAMPDYIPEEVKKITEVEDSPQIL